MSVSYDVMKSVLECVTSVCNTMHSHYDESECKINTHRIFAIKIRLFSNPNYQ